jgi:hypothetical protein
LTFQRETFTRPSTSIVPSKDYFRYIPKKFLKYYIEQRLWEYLALGGLKELVERKLLIKAEYNLPDTFYWDLWGNLEHLREAYSVYCAEELFGPEDSEEESVASLGTQT